MSERESLSTPGGADAGRARRALQQEARGMAVLAALYVAGVNLYSLGYIVVVALPPGDAALNLRNGLFAVAAVGCALLLWLVVEVWTAQRRWACVVLMLLAGIEAVWELLQFFSNQVGWYRPFIAIVAAGCGVQAVRAASKLRASETDEDPAPASVRYGLRGRLLGYGLALGAVLVAIALQAYLHRVAPTPATPLPPPAPAGSSAPVTEAVVPAAELQDLFDPPNPATISALVSRVHELCDRRGTEGRPLSFDEQTEMADGEIAIFEAMARRGRPRSAAEDICYRNARDQEGEAVENQKLRDGAPAADTPTPASASGPSGD